MQIDVDVDATGVDRSHSVAVSDSECGPCRNSDDNDALTTAVVDDDVLDEGRVDDARTVDTVGESTRLFGASYVVTVTERPALCQNS